MKKKTEGASLLPEDAKALRSLIQEQAAKIEEQEATIDRLVHENKNWEHRYAVLEEVSDRDPLTKLPNLRAYNAAVNRFLRRVSRGVSNPKGENVLSHVLLMLFDLDDFKSVNDTYGHSSGNEALKQFAHRLTTDLIFRQQELRADDLVARLHGDEFAMVLPGTPQNNIERRLKNGGRHFRRLAFEAMVEKDGLPVKLEISVSCGFTEYSYPEDWSVTYRRADEALYKAKNMPGGGRIVAAKRI